MTDNDKIAILLRKDSLEDLCAVLSDPCDDCENEGSCPKSCGCYEQDGLQIGKAHAIIELKRRKEIINKALKR